jgi:hypothetical protein
MLYRVTPRHGRDFNSQRITIRSWPWQPLIGIWVRSATSSKKESYEAVQSTCRVSCGISINCYNTSSLENVNRIYLLQDGLHLYLSIYIYTIKCSIINMKSHTIFLYVNLKTFNFIHISFYTYNRAIISWNTVNRSGCRIMTGLTSGTVCTGGLTGCWISTSSTWDRKGTNTTVKTCWTNGTSWCLKNNKTNKDWKTDFYQY